MRKVITYGTFDLLHEGHRRLFERAKALGNYLIVAISTDEFNKIKGKEAMERFETRKKNVENNPYVDKVIAEHEWSQKKEDIEYYDVDILVMGSDWENVFDEYNEFCKVVYLPRTEGVSSSDIRKKIKEKSGLK